MKKSNINNIYFKADLYCKISEASLRSDMVNRIMHSVLPAVADKTQVSTTGGVVDYNSLDAAVYGRKDVIKYGTRACIKELDYYKPDSNLGDQTRKDAQKYLDSKDYTSALKECVKAFSDIYDEAWHDNYGGLAWERIAKSLLRLSILDTNLKEVVASKSRNPNAMEEEINIKKQILLELNVFDGLSHNTASIMENLVNEEMKDLKAFNPELKEKNLKSLNEGGLDLSQIEMKKIKKLMDSKEIADPFQVFKQIENDIKGTGEGLRYKEWIQKIKSRPEYSIDKSDEVSSELFLVDFRRTAANRFHQLNRTLTIASNEINKANKKNNFIDLSFELYESIVQSLVNAQILLQILHSTSVSIDPSNVKARKNASDLYNKLKEIFMECNAIYMKLAKFNPVIGKPSLVELKPVDEIYTKLNLIKNIVAPYM